MSRGHTKTQKAKRDVLLVLDEELMAMPEQERNLRMYEMQRRGLIAPGQSLRRATRTFRGKLARNIDDGAPGR